jgi:Zn-dependent protease
VSVGIRIAGFRITIDPLLPVVIVVMGWLLGNHYLPYGSYWAGGLASVLLTLSILFHELGHAVSARRHHLSIERIHLFLFGGMAELRTRPMNAKQEAEVALAGPAASVLLGLAAFAAASMLADAGGMAYRLFHFVGQMNLLLAIFNLFPMYPLDGGRAVRALFWHLSARYVRASLWIRHVSVAMVVLLAVVVLFEIWRLEGRGWFLYVSMVVYMAYTVAAGTRELLVVPKLTDMLLSSATYGDWVATRSIFLPQLDKDLMLTGVKRPDQEAVLDPTIGRHVDVSRPDTYRSDVRYEADLLPVVDEGRFLGLADAGELRFWLLEWPKS